MIPKRNALLAALVLSGCSGNDAEPPNDFRVVMVGEHRVEAEVARTPKNLEAGLQGREEPDNTHGMLFVFEGEDKRCMWMKGVDFPLSVAFFDASGTVIGVDDMDAGSSRMHCSEGKAAFALEMRKGWFFRNGVGKGAKLAIPPDGT